MKFDSITWLDREVAKPAYAYVYASNGSEHSMQAGGSLVHWDLRGDTLLPGLADGPFTVLEEVSSVQEAYLAMLIWKEQSAGTSTSSHESQY